MRLAMRKHDRCLVSYQGSRLHSRHPIKSSHFGTWDDLDDITGQQSLVPATHYLFMMTISLPLHLTASLPVDLSFSRVFYPVNK